MKVLKITPRGYCHGVVNALQIVANVLADKTIVKPVYLLGEIVHNQNVTNVLKSKGIITLEGSTRKEMLDHVESGTVIVTAHGIDPNLIAAAQKKGLNVVDATCVDVYKTHNIIKEKLDSGFEVIYIGKKNHPEPEGVLGIDSQKIHLVSNKDDISNLQITADKICITNQTTMSLWDTIKLMEHAKNIYPHLEIINEICSATSVRQEAVAEIGKLCDLVIVVGDPKSNNTNRLVEIAQKIANVPAIRINKVDELDYNLLFEYDVVGVTSGASTPTIITTEVINYLESFNANDKTTWEPKSKIDYNRIIPRAKI